MHDLGPEILENDIRLRNKIEEDFLSPLALQVNGDRLLAGVHGHKRESHQLLRHSWVGPEPASQIAPFRILDLDNLRTHTCELIATEWPCQYAGQIDYPNAFER